MQSYLAKRLMNLWRNQPRADDGSLNEIFRQARYLEGTPEEQRALRRSSSEWRYRYDTETPFFDLYFPDFDYRRFLAGRRVLDFGCFTGGRGVRWAKEYGLEKIYGTDINPVYIQAANEFADAHGVPHDYKLLGPDGRIPFPDGEVDTIVTFDVLEHVDDLERSMRECLRVLKPNGVMFVVFPSFYNPLESHLDLVTRMPALQWFFSPKALSQAYREILADRGAEAAWYAPHGRAAWEKLPTLNGTTARAFRRLLARLPVGILHETRTPVGVTGRRFSVVRKLVIKPVLQTALAVRIFDDLLLDRVAMVLQRQ